MKTIHFGKFTLAYYKLSSFRRNKLLFSLVVCISSFLRLVLSLLFLVALGLIAVGGLSLVAVASLVAKHRPCNMWTSVVVALGLRNCGTQA